MRFILLLLLAFVIINTSCRKDDLTNIYLNQWIGKYEGTSYHWSTHPTQINGQWQVTTNESYKDVAVLVIPGARDSCLDFIITINNATPDTLKNLLFSDIGEHFSSSGGGSGYESLKISFESDSLFFSKYYKCGIPCSGGIEFNIRKVN